MKKRQFLLLPLVLLLGGREGVCPAHAAGQAADASWAKLRQQALDRPRRLIFNNDGNEPVYFCDAATEEELLRSRTAPLAGSQVDAIFYCTWSSGFGLFTHHTRVGQVFDTREAMFSKNRTREFLEKGLDPLTVMTRFAHAHGMELFWSLRMNDTHDGARAEYGPVMFRANRLKQQHPDWLIGTQDKPPRYGAWSAVDYGVEEVRDLAFRFCEEVCTNYDVDGLELDFFRHAFLFRCSGQGQPCGQRELEQLTGLIRRIRVMTEATGQKRGRPILLAVRVPDSVEYCRFIGIDLESWLREGLVDLLVVTGYTQLNPWEYSVALGRRHGVKVHASLDEPRLRDEAARESRASLAAYRGRALNAWDAGADGIYLFNYFDPASPLWRELDSPGKLRQLEREYYVSIRGAGAMPVPHQPFIGVPTLNPANPLALPPGQTKSIEFRSGEDFTAARPAPRLSLKLRFNLAAAAAGAVATLNGKALSEGRTSGDWLEFEPGAETFRPGNNQLLLLTTAEKGQLLDLCVRASPGAQ